MKKLLIFETGIGAHVHINKIPEHSKKIEVVNHALKQGGRREHYTYCRQLWLIKPDDFSIDRKAYRVLLDGHYTLICNVSSTGTVRRSSGFSGTRTLRTEGSGETLRIGDTKDPI